MVAPNEVITRQLRASAELILVMEDQVETIQHIARAVETCLRSGGKVILFGNGGSAADAQHIAGELTGKFRLHRPALPALALTTNTSLLTAIANDYDYDQVFSRQVEAWALPGDVVIGISTSGKSRNVVEALRVAKAKGSKTVGFCGCETDLMMAVTDFCIGVPSNDTPRIQEVHITLGHIVCDIVEQSLFG